MTWGDDNQTGDHISRDSAGRDVNYIGGSIKELSEILFAFTGRLDAYREADLEREAERERRDRIDREKRQYEIDLHNESTRNAIAAIREEQAAARRSMDAVRSWLIGLTFVLVITASALAAVIIDRAILNPLLGAVLALLWRMVAARIL